MQYDERRKAKSTISSRQPMLSEAGVPFANKVVPDAYHGTSLESARLIIKDEKFNPSNESDYLGPGIYFYDGSLEYAIETAIRRNEGKDIAVIIAKIQLGKCLDFCDLRTVKMAQRVKKKLEESTGEVVTDPAVINWIATQFTRVDTVRAIYPNKGRGKIFPYSKYYYSQLVICVRNDDCIKELKEAKRMTLVEIDKYNKEAEGGLS